MSSAQVPVRRTGVKAQVHAVMAKQGVLPPLAEMFGPAGRQFLDNVPFDRAYALQVESLLELVDAFDKEISLFEAELHKLLKADSGYRAVQAIDGVGKTMAAIFVAEIGDVSRFSSPDKLACWAGLTPRHDESDTTVHRYGVTKMGSKLVRWAAIEAVARYHGGAPMRASYQRIAARRGNKVAPGDGGQETAQPRLLRPARRRSPLLGRRGLSMPGHGQDASSPNGMTPRTWAWSRKWLSPPGRGRTCRAQKSAYMAAPRSSVEVLSPGWADIGGWPDVAIAGIGRWDGRDGAEGQALS